MSKQRKPTREDRVAVYIDSSSMLQRVKRKKQLSARILGEYGNYRTTCRISKNIQGTCSCPSEINPCKHILALRETWNVDPDSFFDMDKFLKELEAQPQEWLVEMIGSIISHFPECLSVFRIPGFEDDTEDSWIEY